MATTIEVLPRVALPASNDGGVFQKTFVSAGGSDTKIYVLPYHRAEGPAVSRDGTLAVYVGNPNPKTVIESTDPAATDADIIWTLWDGESGFHPDITVIKVVEDASPGKIAISVKTDRN